MTRSSTLARQDGGEIDVDVFLSCIEHDTASWTVLSIRDVTARREAERVLEDSELRFRLAFEDNMGPMIFTDLEDRIIAANDAFCQMLGATRDDLFGYDSKPFTYPEDLGITEETHRKITHGEAEQVRYTKRYLHKNGRMIVAEVSKSPARDADGKTLYYVISERDITDRVQRDHLLTLLAEVNKLGMHASSESVLLQQICDVLVHEGGYALAWIGVTSETEPDGVDVQCASGATKYLYDGMVSTSERHVSGLGPTGRALRSGTSQAINDLAHDESFEPWRERAAEFGFGSSVAIPDESGLVAPCSTSTPRTPTPSTRRR